MTINYEYHKKWRKKNPDKRNAERKRNYRRTQFANRNQGQRYDQDHDWLILNSPFTDRELHKIIGRSVQAIQIRRSRLKQKLVPVGGLNV